MTRRDKLKKEKSNENCDLMREVTRNCGEKEERKKSKLQGDEHRSAKLSLLELRLAGLNGVQFD